VVRPTLLDRLPRAGTRRRTLRSDGARTGTGHSERTRRGVVQVRERAGRARPADRDETVGDALATLAWPGLLGTALDWPPDVFAATSMLLERSEAYRFVVSPPSGEVWPPPRIGDWELETSSAARAWTGALAGPGRPDLPPLLVRSWQQLVRHLDTPLAALADGTAWPLCTALLVLHVVADEACAGIGNATDVSFDLGCELRARAREHLAERGSLSRLPHARLRVLPKAHFPTGGLALRSLSRHVAVTSSPADLLWLKAPKGPRRPPNVDGHSTLVLLPWPYHIDTGDFRPTSGPLQNMDPDAYRFFEFARTQGLDLDLVHRVLHTASRIVGNVDALVLPESSVDLTELPALENVLSDHRVPMLVAGVRQPGGPNGRLGSNFVEFGVNAHDGWRSHRQAKHHRWSLDERQIRQYRLGDALDPSTRWWEAIEIPFRGVQVVEMGQGMTVTPLICEDLARIDAATDLLRSIGPTLIVAPLLDGPQLAGRWASRHAAALADDPGCSVLTLTCLGMVARSGLPGDPPARVVALWNDLHGPPREIELAPGHHAVLLQTRLQPNIAWTADGRRHRGAPSLVLTEVVQLAASTDLAHPAAVGPAERHRPLPCGPAQGLDHCQLTKLVGWCEALAEAAVETDATTARRLIRAARPGAAWREPLGLPEPDGALADALAAIDERITAALSTTAHLPMAILAAAAVLRRSTGPASSRLAGRVLTTAMWQRLEGREDDPLVIHRGSDRSPVRTDDEDVPHAERAAPGRAGRQSIGAD
jgi:hypothetical protein